MTKAKGNIWKGIIMLVLGTVFYAPGIPDCDEFFLRRGKKFLRILFLFQHLYI